MGNRISKSFTFFTSYRRRDHERRPSSSADDRISDLPDDILHHILSFLPLKSVGQTSVLSTRWIYLWNFYPTIEYPEIVTGNEAIDRRKKARIINTLLAPLRKDASVRVSQVGPPGVNEEEEELFIFLKRKEEEELVLISCGKSSKASLQFPSSYLVKSYLHTLEALSMTDVDFLDGAFSTVDLFSGSWFPSLKKLSIENCGGMSHLKISCPNLKDLRIAFMDSTSIDITGVKLESLGVSLCFTKSRDESRVRIVTPNLCYFIWGCNVITNKCSIQCFPRLRMPIMSYWENDLIAKENSVVDLLSASSQVEVLHIPYSYIKLLQEQDGLSFSFMKLGTLKIDDLYGMNKRCMACLLKSTPNVHTLQITIRRDNILLDDAGCKLSRALLGNSGSKFEFLS